MKKHTALRLSAIATIAASLTPSLRASESDIHIPDLNAVSFMGGSLTGSAVLLTGLGKGRQAHSSCRETLAANSWRKTPICAPVRPLVSGFREGLEASARPVGKPSNTDTRDRLLGG